MQRFGKVLLVILAFVLLARYFPPLYYAWLFNDFVKNEAKRSKTGRSLQTALLQQAEVYFLPVKADDIQIKEDDGLIRVNVDYKVPVNLFVFPHELSFHAAGAGVQPQN